MQRASTSLIVGGNGALGKAMVSSFRAGGWNTVSLDVVANQEAQHNIIVNPNVSMKSQVSTLVSEVQRASVEYNAIICVAGGFGCSNIADNDIMEAYEEQDRINF